MFLRHEHLDALSGAALADLEDRVNQFEDAWQRGERPALEDYLPAGGAARRAILLELVHSDLECRLRAGEAARLETYLGRYPELRDRREAVLDLVAAEYRLRQHYQPGPTPAEYARRFPDHTAD